MGLLLLPSLEEKRHIRMENISKDEAILFINDFETRVKASRKLKTPSVQIDDAFKVYKLLDDDADYFVDDLADYLGESNVPQHRGIRAVFIDEDTNDIIVGTTVVYSASWAMVGFDDMTVDAMIWDFAD